MDGIHDLGGMQGFGPVPYRPGDGPFHEPWERRVFGLTLLAQGAAGIDVDRFRHGIERVPPVDYLAHGYYGRWLRGIELLLAEGGVLRRGEVDDRVAGRPPAGAAPGAASDGPSGTSGRRRGARREIERDPRFAPGDAVRARDIHPRGHTRLPRYARGRRGTVTLVHPAFVFPDTNAHGLGERPQHAYAVRFAARELWGPEADAAAAVHVDLFEEHLEPADA